MGQGDNIQGVYIADGFADDCDELMHRCLRVETLTFEIFSEIWKDMQLSCLFQGRSSGAEIAELSEEVIHIAKRYMVANTSMFEEAIAGLFLVYSLLNLQPFPNFASLRIVQDDVPAIERIELIARSDRRLDVLFILGSVLIKGPVQYHAALRERGMEYPIRKYLEGYTTIDKVGVRPKGVFRRQNRALDLTRELANIASRYSSNKDRINFGVPVGQRNRNKDRSLTYHLKEHPEELECCMKNTITGNIDEDDGAASSDSGNSTDAVKNLKDKAMRAKVNPMRHLVSTRSQPNSTTSDNKSSSVTVQNSNSAKGTTVKGNAKRQARKRKRKTLYDTSTSEDEAIKSDNPDYEYDGDEKQDGIGDEIDVTSFLKKIGADETPPANEQEIDIEIDSLPCVIRSEDNGKSYEIEVIDELIPVSQPENIEVVNNSQETSSSAESDKKKTEANDKAFCKKTEKKDLKKTILKSRFKRMGMLPVANFQNK